VKIGVIGLGRVGLTTAACLAHVGHEVSGVDADTAKVDVIGRGDAPFYEPGLLELVRAGVDSGRLRATSDPGFAVRGGDAVFICVGTPTRPSGEADLDSVTAAALAVADHLDAYRVVIGKSTVPVATTEWLRQSIELRTRSGVQFDVASNPEFLREGSAVADTLEPDRIVVGASSSRAVELVREIYRPILDRSGCPFIVTDTATAELVKLASNAFLATKVSFINAVADLCDRTGADVRVVGEAMGLDPRIGPSYLGAGIGYGGSCFPKDVRAFRHVATRRGVDFAILDAVERLNDARIETFGDKVHAVAGDLDGARVAVWGLAFKPDTDDIANSSAVRVVQDLLARGAAVTCYDPAAMEPARVVLPGVEFAGTALDAAQGADCLVVATEWREFLSVDLDRLRGSMTRPVVVDGRNVFDPAAMAAAGFTYASVGRPTVSPVGSVRSGRPVVPAVEEMSATAPGRR
jgi:UDPglucose 6-dehydrogenase